MIPLDGMRSSRASGNLLCPGLGIAALCLLGCGADAPAGGDGGATGATSAPDGVAPAEGAPTSDVPFAGPQADAAASGGSGGTPGTPPVPDAAGSGAGGVSGASDGDDDAGLATPCDPGSARGHFQLERLDRGLVAVRVGDANYVGWRMLGHEYDGGDPELGSVASMLSPDISGGSENDASIHAFSCEGQNADRACLTPPDTLMASLSALPARKTSKCRPPVWCK